MNINRSLRLTLTSLLIFITITIIIFITSQEFTLQPPIRLVRSGQNDPKRDQNNTAIDQQDPIDQPLIDQKDPTIDRNKPTKPRTALTSTEAEEREVRRCKCRVGRVRSGKVTRQELDAFLPWLNRTTKQDLSTHHPNLPVEFVYNASSQRSCRLIPTPWSIEWCNRHWQEAVVGEGRNVTMFLYSAFYDPKALGGGGGVVLLGVSKAVDPGRPWCHIWYSTHEPPHATRAALPVHIDYQGKNSNRQMPYLLTCPLPPDPANTLPIPAAVSIVASPCTFATTLLKVEGAREREKSAYRSGQVPKTPHSLRKGWVPAVCGPALYYYNQDFSSRLVEWLELLRAMGFGQVFLYMSDVHPNIEKVLQYYQQDGYIEVTDYAYPPPYINEPSIRRLWTLTERQKMFAQENIYFSDCLLRHMHQYRFITHFDPDEVPILPHHHNFTHFLDDILNRTRKWRAGFRLQWRYFCESEPREKTALLPDYLWVLRRTCRSEKDPKSSPGKFKAIYDMEEARGVFSHGVVCCVTGKCTASSMKNVTPKDAYLGHFKGVCEEEGCSGEGREELWLQRYKERVSQAVEKVLKKLGLI